jgi:pimeloyl-ACP methyl ester carboxylesterase
LDHPGLAASLVLMEPALRVKTESPASQDLTRRMAVGFQRYREGDREGAVAGFLGATFAPGYRRQIEQMLPNWWEDAVRDADAFFGTELPALPWWQLGDPEAKRITAPVLSLRGALSDPAFVDFERLLRGWFPQLETVEVSGVDHRLHLQRPDLVGAALAEFLARHPLSG